MALQSKASKQGRQGKSKGINTTPLGLMSERLDFLRFTKTRTRPQHKPEAQPPSPLTVLPAPEETNSRSSSRSSSSSSSSVSEDCSSQRGMGNLSSPQMMTGAGEMQRPSLLCAMPVAAEEEDSDSENEVGPAIGPAMNSRCRGRRLSMDFGITPSRSHNRATPRGSVRCSFDAGADVAPAKSPNSQSFPRDSCTAGVVAAHTPHRSNRRVSLDREDKEAALYYGFDKSHETDSRSSGARTQRRSSSQSKAPAVPLSPVQSFSFQGFSGASDSDQCSSSASQKHSVPELTRQRSPYDIQTIHSHRANKKQGVTEAFCYRGQVGQDSTVDSNFPWHAERIACSPAYQTPGARAGRRQSVDLGQMNCTGTHTIDVETDEYETSDMSDAAEFLSSSHLPAVPVSRGSRRLSSDFSGAHTKTSFSV